MKSRLAKLTNNWGLKLVSIIIAFVLWLAVTNIDDPVSTYRVYNVPVTIKNAELVTGRGQVYEILDNSDVIDMVTITAKRSIIDSLDEDDIIATADMADLTSIGTLPIRLSTNKHYNKIESIIGSEESVQLSIETGLTRSLPLKTSTIGEVKDGYMVGDITAEQNLVEITGPESIINEVSKAVASVDVSGFTSNIGTDAEVKLYNSDDEEIVATSVKKNITKVRVSVEILELKSVPLVWNISGTPADGYQATGVVECDMEEILIAGKAKVIDSITEILIPDDVLDVTGATGDVSKAVNIASFLPDGVIMGNGSSIMNIQVTALVEPEVERTIKVDTGKINVINMPDGFKGVITDPVDEYEITMIGLRDNLNSVSSKDIVAYIDIEEAMEAEGITSIKAGHMNVNVNITLPDDLKVKGNVTVRMTITEE